MQGTNWRTMAGVGVLAAAAVVLFLVLKGGSDSSDNDTGQEAFAFQVAGGEAVGGAQQIDVTKGDQVTITLQTDVMAELHIHGYELAKDVKAGGEGSISFAADDEGRFEVEAHPLINGEEQAGIQLAELSVNP